MEFNRKKKNMANCEIPISITPILQDFTDFFSISLVFNMFFILVLVEVKLNGI